MIVVDASAAVAGLLNDGQARQALADEHLHTPHVVDSEVANALRRRVIAGTLDAADGWRAVDAWRRLGITRYPTFTLLHRSWQLRHNLTAYDAAYVALAELLGCPLLTADARLSRAPGLRCALTLVPH